MYRVENNELGKYIISGDNYNLYSKNGILISRKRYNKITFIGRDINNKIVTIKIPVL